MVSWEGKGGFQDSGGLAILSFTSCSCELRKALTVMGQLISIRFNHPNSSLLLQGYAVAWSEEGDILNMVLLKYFAKEHKQDWIREVDVAKRLCNDSEELPVLLNYRWHSKGEWMEDPSYFVLWTEICTARIISFAKQMEISVRKKEIGHNHRPFRRFNCLFSFLSSI